MSSAKVNRPTNVKVKEEDVNRKLQFYGIFSAFQVGKVPSNEQIDIALNSFLQSQALASPSKRLSAEGQALVADFRSVVEQAKYLILTKNEGNLLQDFIWESQKVDGGNAALPNAPIDGQTAKQHGNQALDGLRTLGTLLISNGQFRKLLDDALILLRDIAGDAATKAADKVNPSEAQLSQIDRPAEDNTWHDVPDMSAGNIKNQIKTTYGNPKPLDRNDLKDAAGDASQAAHPSGSRDPTDTAYLAGQDQRYDTASGVDAQSGYQNAAKTLRERASENVPDETKEKAKDHGRAARERTKNYLSEKMPEERRDQVRYRMKKLLVELQGHPDYQQAITTLLDLAEEYAGHLNNVTQQSTGTVKGAHADTSLQRAEKNLKVLIERFANGTSTDDLFSSLNQIYRDADQDPELKSWFRKVDTYIRKCLKKQGYVMEDGATDEWNEIYDRGNFLLRDRYRNHTDRIADEVKFLADQFDRDPQNKRFGESMQKLFLDLGNDENGKATFKPHLVKDLTEVILPAAFENIRYVPIPRIEFSDPQFDFIVENLVVESDNLMPNIFEIANDNYFRWGRKNVANKKHNSIMVSVSGIQMDLKDVSYYVKKKEGFPSLTDLGVLDIFLGGTGFSFKMKLSTAHKKDRQNFFKVDNVDVDVKNFNIKIKTSKHKLLFTLAKSLMLKTLRPALQKALEKVIKEKVHELDGYLYSIKLEADRAQEEIQNDPENAPNIYQRYVTAVQKQVLQGKEKGQEVASNTKVNVAITKQDSIFPDIHLPGGISSKATEYKELALKGTSWESPVFTIGSASKTQDIPHAPTVTRKEHAVTQGGVRGPQNIGNTESMSSQFSDPRAQATGTTSGSNDTAYATDRSYNTGTTSTFSNQVEQAFSKEGTPTAAVNGNGSTGRGGNGYTNTNGNTNGFNGSTKLNSNTRTAANGNLATTLGANNPVYNGSV